MRIPIYFRAGCIAAMWVGGCVAASTLPSQLLSFSSTPDSETEAMEKELGLTPTQPIMRAKVKVLKPPPAPKATPPRPEETASEWIASSVNESLIWLEHGKELLRAGKYDAAVGAFTRFLNLAPDHALAHEAQYFIGESYFKSREYGLALISFNRLLAQFPQSPKIPEAMQALARCQAELGTTQN